MNTARLSMLALGILGPGTVFPAEFTVRLDQDHYRVEVGVPFDLAIVMDPPPAEGLFSFGVRLGYDVVAGPDIQAEDIAVAPLLDFNGPLGAGARRDFESGFLGIKGTVDPVLEPREGYEGEELARLKVTFLEVGDYRLDLSLYNTLGGTEQVFVSGTGNSLDATLAFQGATVSVIPEAGPAVLFLMGGGGLWLLGRTPRKGAV